MIFTWALWDTLLKNCFKFSFIVKCLSLKIRKKIFEVQLFSFRCSGTTTSFSKASLVCIEVPEQFMKNKVSLSIQISSTAWQNLSVQSQGHLKILILSFSKYWQTSETNNMTWRKEKSVGVNGEGSLGKPWYLSPPSGELERIHNHPFSGGFLEKKKKEKCGLTINRKSCTLLKAKIKERSVSLSCGIMIWNCQFVPQVSRMSLSDCQASVRLF